MGKGTRRAVRRRTEVWRQAEASKQARHRHGPRIGLAREAVTRRCRGLGEMTRLEYSSKNRPTEEAGWPLEESQGGTATEIDAVSRILGLYPLRMMWDTCQRQTFHRE